MSKKNISSTANFQLLKDLLRKQKIEFDELSKKKSNEQLNPMKIKILNRVLIPLKEYFIDEACYNFLDILNADDFPTYSDVVLIISQYQTAISEYSSRRY